MLAVVALSAGAATAVRKIGHCVIYLFPILSLRIKNSSNIFKLFKFLEIMTEEQKSKAIFYMAGQHRVYRSNHRRFMEDGDQIRFTKVINDGMNNQEYEINDCEDWSMWFSQLSQIHITQDIDDLCASTIKFLDGNKLSIHAMEAWEFYEKVKGKTFKVSGCPSFAAIKSDSSFWDNPENTYRDALDYVKNCIENDNLGRLGDLLRPALLYYLEEI